MTPLETIAKALAGFFPTRAKKLGCHVDAARAAIEAIPNDVVGKAIADAVAAKQVVMYEEVGDVIKKALLDG